MYSFTTNKVVSVKNTEPEKVLKTKHIKHLKNEKKIIDSRHGPHIIS